jgi:2-phospho-L-lactate/phosphoenolpyruvate guanylyltransferase
VALVPLRAPGVGKSRLAGALSTDQRAALAGAMLADVVAALEGASLDGIVVAAGGPTAVAAASALGLDVVADPPGVHGLDTALRAAAARLGSVGTLIVVAADLPRLAADDVSRMLACAADVAVARTVDGGTGGLLRRPSDVIRTAYGPDSARRHMEMARRAGVTARTLRLEGFAHDVDVVSDLAALGRTDLPALGARTAALLRQPDFDAAAG